MATFFEDEEEDVLAPKEPQVNSSDPNERKAARELRIKRRQEALKKAELPPEEILEEDQTLTEKTTIAAAEALQKCSLEGIAKVTNVKITADEREVNRRHKCAEIARATQQKMEDEAVQTQLEYEAIAQNWEAMMKIRDPLDIDVAMKEQKNDCDHLLALKDGLIKKLKGDLAKMDQEYFEDLQKQDNDIKEMSIRIEKQITIMSRAYEKQLNLIEEALNIEREAMVEYNNKRWDALYRQRDKEELQHIEYKFKQLEAHKQEIDDIMWEHYEKYRQTKIELENLISELQKELEKLKAVCLINTEKIGYNYQILKKREEENVFVRSQQKRKLNKMTDIANGLRKKIHQASSAGAHEEKRADAEIAKLMEAMDELEKKAHHFAHVNNYKFIQVWRMSATRCSGISRELRAMELAIHAHILAEPPPAAPPPPPRAPFNKEESEEKLEVVKVTTNKADFEDSKQALVRHILQLVADNTGFLVEDRLLTLLAKYPMTSRNLCTLDAIFMALEISAEKDIELLCNTFLDYAFCPICAGMDDGVSEYLDPSGSQPGDTSTMRGRASSVRARASIAKSLSTSTSRSVGFRGHELSPEEQALLTEADEIMGRVGDPQAVQAMTGASTEAGLAAARRGVTVTSTPEVGELTPTDPYRCPEGHLLEIEPMQVLTALGDFISQFMPPEKKKLHDLLESLKPPTFDTISRSLTDKDIEQYWTSWKLNFPPEKDHYWDGILKGVTNYLQVLKERDALHEEVQAVRLRNAELRRLVRGALPELPPIAQPPPANVATDDHQLPKLPKIT